MDLLGLVILIAISIISSVKKSNDAKQQSAKRKGQSQTVYQSKSSSIPEKERKAAAPKPAASSASKDGFDTLSEVFDGLNKMLGLGQEDKKSASQKSQKTHAGTAAGKKNHKKAAAQTAKKSPSQLPKQTLMEQRPDREQREAHTKVSANVKPLKNAFENDEHCEHRIELNPNIQYSSQKQNVAAQRVAAVKTDGDSIVQGMIWAEILGKPKAYQKQTPGFRR